MRTLMLASLLGLLACGSHSDDPTPAPPPTAAPWVVPVAKTHVVELRYWLVSYGDASQLPASAPLINLALRPVGPGPGGASVYQPAQLLLQVTDVSTAVKTVKLPDVTTYTPGPLPVLIATVIAPAVPAIGPGLGYYVEGHYTVDGVVDPARAVFYDPVSVKNPPYPFTAQDPLSSTTEYMIKP